MGRLLVKVLTLANQIIRIQILYKNGTLLSDFQTLCMNYMLYFYVYLFFYRRLIKSYLPKKKEEDEYQ